MESQNLHQKIRMKEDIIDTDFRQFLTFNVGSEIYGIDISGIREVIDYNDVYKIPRVPEYIRGVTNLRGEVVPVIDLSSRFYDKISDVTILTNIVVCEIAYKEKSVILGIIIDKVNAVIDIPENNIEPSPQYGAKIRPDFIDAIGKVENDFVILLNIEKVLNIEELSDIADEF